jgi:hypothetical protein
LPRAVDAQSPAAGLPGPAPTETSTTSGPAGDLSPRTHHGDKAGRDDAASASPSEGAEAVLPVDLALADILPYTPNLEAAAAPDAPAPSGPAPAGEAVADYGRAPRSHWPLIAGMFVTLAILLFGGGWLWWRNRDVRYWPA